MTGQNDNYTRVRTKYCGAVAVLGVTMLAALFGIAANKGQGESIVVGCLLGVIYFSMGLLFLLFPTGIMLIVAQKRRLPSLGLVASTLLSGYYFYLLVLNLFGG